MSADEHTSWPEHAVCARCGTPLGEHYRESPLGLRFCNDCFGGAIQEKARERAAELYLHGRCSGCGGSLINGYRLTTLGVVYCLSCFEHLPTPETKPWSDTSGKEPEGDEALRASKKLNAVFGVFLLIGLVAAHVLFYMDALVKTAHSPLIHHPDSYFKSLACLDLLTILFLLVWNRFPSTRLRAVTALLIASGFIILVGREVAVVLGL